MKKFLQLMQVSEVVNLLAAEAPLTPIRLPLDTAAGHILAADIVAAENIPSAHRSAMDGYAVQAADLLGVGENNPAWLDLVDDIAIDAPSSKQLYSGQCMGIVTGGHVPMGADAVVMVEHTAMFSQGLVEFRRAVAQGEHIMRLGDDAQKGAVALAEHTLLRPQEIGLLAALGITKVPVYPRPRVAILSTGDEVIPIEATPTPGQVRDVNTYTLAAMCKHAGCTVEPLGIVNDDLDALVDRLREACSLAQIVLLSGGSSVGLRDLTMEALQRLGNVEILCHGLAMSPGKPLIIAKVSTEEGVTSVWGLPGQVTSAQVVAQILALPFIRHLSGHVQAFNRTHWRVQKAVLARNMASRQGREDFIRVRLEADTDLPAQYLAIPLPGLSGLLRTLIAGHGVMCIPADMEGFEAGRVVDVILFAD